MFNSPPTKHTKPLTAAVGMQGRAMMRAPFACYVVPSRNTPAVVLIERARMVVWFLTALRHSFVEMGGPFGRSDGSTARWA